MVLGQKTLFLAIGLLGSIRAEAATELVRVVKTIDDQAIIARANGQTYLIEKGVGCLSLSFLEGKTVIITSPGLFLGVGSRLLIPERSQECRIWDSKQLEGTVASLGDQVRPTEPPARERTTCSHGHWVAHVSSGGEIVRLEDDSLWEIDDLDVIDTMLWLPTDDVSICGRRLINTDQGDTVSATQIK